MPVGLHGERTAVLVAQPPGDRWNVNARLNAPRGEHVPQVIHIPKGSVQTIVS